MLLLEACAAEYGPLHCLAQPDPIGWDLSLQGVSQSKADFVGLGTGRYETCINLWYTAGHMGQLHTVTLCTLKC
jgi:hypothetical protein